MKSCYYSSSTWCPVIKASTTSTSLPRCPGNSGRRSPGFILSHTWHHWTDQQMSTVLWCSKCTCTCTCRSAGPSALDSVVWRHVHSLQELFNRPLQCTGNTGTKIMHPICMCTWTNPYTKSNAVEHHKGTKSSLIKRTCTVFDLLWKKHRDTMFNSQDAITRLKAGLPYVCCLSDT